MLRFAVLVFVAISILDVKSYVIKDENTAKESDQETELNKNKDEINNFISRRKRTSNYNGNQNKMAHSNSKSDKLTSQSLDSVVLALNTGIQKILEQNNKSDFLDKYAKKIMNLFSEHGHKSDGAQVKYGIKPEVVHFNAEKPTKKFELNAKVLANLINNFLKSDTFKHNFDNVVRQASIVYRAVQEADKKKE